MKMHWQYLKAVLRHKWFVFWACLRMGVPIWNAILHDWDKFLPDEWFAYARYFYGPKVVVPNTWTHDKNGNQQPVMKAPDEVQRAFDYAWNLHQKRNKHHWQFWLLRFDNPKPTFSFQSYDGGMTHCYIADMRGQKAAIVEHADIDWWKPDHAAERQLMRELNYVPTALPMPDRARREMLADWVGAGKAYNRNFTSIEPVRWWNAHKDDIQLHPETRAWVEEQMAERKRRYERDMHFAKVEGRGWPTW